VTTLSGAGAPDDARALYESAQQREADGDFDGAVTQYRAALHADPRLREIRQHLTILLVRLGRVDDCIALWQTNDLTEADLHWLDDLSWDAMRAEDLPLAGAYGRVFTATRRASDWFPGTTDSGRPPVLNHRPPAYLTSAKLRHDIDQLLYLRDREIVGDEFAPVIDAYKAVLGRLHATATSDRISLTGDDEALIGRYYNRVLHWRDTPRLPYALSDTWDRDAVERVFRDESIGLVVIDDFLTPQALEEIRHFCLESTIWSSNQYSHGRLGSLFNDGFNCPLLLQVAQELKDALPDIIGTRYPLRQMWGYKFNEHLPADTTVHADFAAVNVNFWITPTEANLDDHSGGLLVYHTDAPAAWDFETYNNRQDLIRDHLARENVEATTVAYRANRAIVFNSDLFHTTAEVRFRPEYHHRRINITMLYGEREDDVYHRPASADSAS